MHKLNEQSTIRRFLDRQFGTNNDFSLIDFAQTEKGKPDAIDTENRLFIEHSMIIDEKDQRDSNRWGAFVSDVQSAINDLDRLDELDGLYSIRIPYDILRKHQKPGKIAKQILDAILDNRKTLNFHGQIIKFKKVDEGSAGVYFVSHGDAGSYSASGDISSFMGNKLPTANKQLGYEHECIIPERRILLFENEYYRPYWNWDLFDALAPHYEDLLKIYKNIDEIWYQHKNENKSTHTLLFKRSFFEAFENLDKIDTDNKEERELFANWFHPFFEMDDKHNVKEMLYKALIQYLETDTPPHELFPHDGQYRRREHMIKLISWLVRKRGKDKAVDFIMYFIDDPDPAEPRSIEETNEDKYPYHTRIASKDSDKTPHSITSVRGKLAWEVQKLVVYNEGESIVEAFQFTQHVLTSTNNLYVVQQWLIPLIEICANRTKLRDKNQELYKQLKALLFELLEKYTEYPALVDYLVRVFNHYRELTTEEVETVLTRLDNAKDYDVLLLVYGVFREKHFELKDEDERSKYNEEVLKYRPQTAYDMLLDKIIDFSHQSANTRSGIIWNVWKILNKNPNYIDKLHKLNEIITIYAQNADKDVITSLENIFDDHLDEWEYEVLDWFIITMTSLHNRYKVEKQIELWLWDKNTKILERIAQKRPDQLVSIVTQLINLWERGAYIGTITDVFDTYKTIQDEYLREKTKKEFQTLHNQMKALHPPLHD